MGRSHEEAHVQTKTGNRSPDRTAVRQENHKMNKVILITTHDNGAESETLEYEEQPTYEEIKEWVDGA